MLHAQLELKFVLVALKRHLQRKLLPPSSQRIGINQYLLITLRRGYKLAVEVKYSDPHTRDARCGT
jgi:hypothetical protein